MASTVPGVQTSAIHLLKPAYYANAHAGVIEDTKGD